MTSSARAHAAAWKKMFDEYLKERSRRTQERYVPFDDHRDYLRYIDGKPRYEECRAFLSHGASRLTLETRTTRQEKKPSAGSEI